MNEDPFSDGALWSFNYFFFNKDLKRICFFTCLARRSKSQLTFLNSLSAINHKSDNEDDDGNEETDEEYTFANKRLRPNEDGEDDEDDEENDIRSQDERDG